MRFVTCTKPNGIADSPDVLAMQKSGIGCSEAAGRDRQQRVACRPTCFFEVVIQREELGTICIRQDSTPTHQR
jgi:hypothetical protein